MSDRITQRDSEPESAEPIQDRVVEALRDIPRLRNLDAEAGKGRVYLPPPPTVSRIGGLAQGCGGVLLSAMAALMLMVALWFGYYLWGPGLLLAGGLLLVVGTVGVWRGRRTPVIASIVVIVVLAGVGYFWSTFVPAAGALSPLGGAGVFLGPLSLLVALVLAVTLISHVISLFYWKRLTAVAPRGAVIWAVAGIALGAIAVGLHITQQQQRASWLAERFDAWTAEASATPLAMGSSANVTLGYSFVTTEADEETQLDVRLAELDAALEAGVALIRVTAGGDLLFERDQPRLFELDEDASAEDVAEAEDRLARQAVAEEQYMARLTGSGVGLMLADAQYSPYLIMWSNEKEKPTWEDFTQMQETRIRHYAALYHPAAYEIITEPDAYEDYSAIDKPDGANMLDLWTDQARRLIQVVQQESPDTQIGITVGLQSDFDLDFYERALELEGLDFIGVRLFQPAAFDVLEDVLAERGRPSEYGKQLWVIETWYGYCLAPQRSMDLDADWLETVAAFAAKEQIATVLVNDYGCFLQAGGTLFQGDADLKGRTEVWERWRQLIKARQPA